ncbi:MAG: response regulator [Patescibacteria group bacterium]
MKEKILIAISDSSLSTLIEQKLTSVGYSTIIARDGKEALEKMKSAMPDLALIDVVLPALSGYEVMTEKSLDRMITKIPVIVVSNAGTTLEMHRIPSTPVMKDYIVKSHIEPDEVLQKIEKALGRGADAPGATPAGTPAKAGGKKVLWVEDDKLLSSILSKKIENSGHILLKANNGEEALEILKTEVPDMIVLDILLPGMTGFEILQKVRTDERFRKLPAMMLSNMSKPSDLEMAKTLGVQRFIVKAAASLDEIIREISNLK